MEYKNHFVTKLLELNPTEYQNANPYPHCVLDNILDDCLALNCQNDIINLQPELWDRYNNPFEQKYTLRDKHNLPTENLKILFGILTSQESLDALSNIVGEKLTNDPTRNWWGVHIFNDGDYLDMHSDAGNHPITKQKKHLTLGIYLSKDWKEENGGHLEIWDGDSVLNNDAKLTGCTNRILPVFNRMIMFTNTTNAWHGSPNPSICKNGERRIFLTLSYLSEKHNDGMENNREKAFFVSRPGDTPNEIKDKLRLERADPTKCKNVYACNKNM